MLLRIIIFTVSLVLLPPVWAMGQNETAQKEPPVFTNQDIEKYKQPSDSKFHPVKTDRTAEKKAKAEKIKEEQEKESWCKKANSYKKKIDKIKDEITEAEKELSEEKGVDLSYKKKKEVQKRLHNARKHLKYAEKDLSELEDEAHRNGIPPGWLRCQFEN